LQTREIPALEWDSYIMNHSNQPVCRVAFHRLQAVWTKRYVNTEYCSLIGEGARNPDSVSQVHGTGSIVT